MSKSAYFLALRLAILRAGRCGRLRPNGLLRRDQESNGFGHDS